MKPGDPVYVRLNPESAVGQFVRRFTPPQRWLKEQLIPTGKTFKAYPPGPKRLERGEVVSVGKKTVTVKIGERIVKRRMADVVEIPI